MFIIIKLKFWRREAKIESCPKNKQLGKTANAFFNGILDKTTSGYCMRDRCLSPLLARHYHHHHPAVRRPLMNIGLSDKFLERLILCGALKLRATLTVSYFQLILT